MKTCVELLVALAVGMLAARLLTPYWPNTHLYGGWQGLLVDPQGLELLQKHQLAKTEWLQTIICQFDSQSNRTAEEELPHLTKLLDVADRKHVVVIVNYFEHLSLFLKVVHQDVEFVYDIKSEQELGKWTAGQFCESCNVSLRITPQLYSMAVEREYPMSRFVAPAGRKGGMVLLQLLCPKQHFWDQEWIQQQEEIGVYKDIAHHLVPEVEYNVSEQQEEVVTTVEQTDNPQDNHQTQSTIPPERQQVSSEEHNDVTQATEVPNPETEFIEETNNTPAQEPVESEEPEPVLEQHGSQEIEAATQPHVELVTEAPSVGEEAQIIVPAMQQTNGEASEQMPGEAAQPQQPVQESQTEVHSIDAQQPAAPVLLEEQPETEAPIEQPTPYAEESQQPVQQAQPLPEQPVTEEVVTEQPPREEALPESLPSEQSSDFSPPAEKPDAATYLQSLELNAHEEPGYQPTGESVDFEDQQEQVHEARQPDQDQPTSQQQVEPASGAEQGSAATPEAQQTSVKYAPTEQSAQAAETSQPFQEPNEISEPQHHEASDAFQPLPDVEMQHAPTSDEPLGQL